MCEVSEILTRELIDVIKPRLNIEISAVNKYENCIKPLESSIGFYVSENHARPGSGASRAIAELSEILETNIDEDVGYLWCKVSRHARNYDLNVYYEVRFICYSLKHIKILDQK